MASKNLEDLTKSVKQKAVVHTQLCSAKGVELLIYCTLRKNDEQAKLYAQGRTEPGKIITNARPGESAHNPDELGQSHAYDCCPMIAGKPIWYTKHPYWAIIGSCGEEAGLVWSGRWTGKMKEMAHFQDPNWSKP